MPVHNPMPDIVRPGGEAGGAGIPQGPGNFKMRAFEKMGWRIFSNINLSSKIPSGQSCAISMATPKLPFKQGPRDPPA